MWLTKGISALTKMCSFFYLRKSCKYEKLLTTVNSTGFFIYSVLLITVKNINPKANKIKIHRVKKSSMSHYLVRVHLPGGRSLGPCVLVQMQTSAECWPQSAVLAERSFLMHYLIWSSQQSLKRPHCTDEKATVWEGEEICPSPQGNLTLNLDLTPHRWAKFRAYIYTRSRRLGRRWGRAHELQALF